MGLVYGRKRAGFYGCFWAVSGPNLGRIWAESGPNLAGCCSDGGPKSTHQGEQNRFRLIPISVQTEMASKCSIQIERVSVQTEMGKTPLFFQKPEKPQCYFLPIGKQVYQGGRVYTFTHIAQK